MSLRALPIELSSRSSSIPCMFRSLFIVTYIRQAIAVSIFREWS